MNSVRPGSRDPPPRMPAMKSYSLFHLADHVLLHDLKTLVARHRITTAELLAHIAEVDERRLYLPAAYPSMCLYCLNELHMSEDSALKRIQAARAARSFPCIFTAVAEGRLHLSAVGLLAPHLTAENAEELLTAAEHRTKAEIALLLAARFPRPDVPTSVQAVAATGATDLMTPAPVVAFAAQPAPGQVESASPSPPPRPTVAPISPGRFDVRFTLHQSAHDLLRYAQALLGHAVPSGDIAEVVKRGLATLVEKLEKRVFAASARPRSQRSAAKGRYVPAAVRRTVWRRDGGRCTFKSAAGQRCPACTRLEFDHAEPMAGGGATTPENLRLRCRAHNQYTAEHEFGAGFMEGKRQKARARTAERMATRARAATHIEHAPAHVDQRERRNEVIPWLRQLGLRVDEAKRGAAMCDDIPEASLEDRVRFALSGLARERFRRGTSLASAAG